MEHAAALASIEIQLTQAAELMLSGSMPESLYASSVHGVLGCFSSRSSERLRQRWGGGQERGTWRR